MPGKSRSKKERKVFKPVAAAPAPEIVSPVMTVTAGQPESVKKSNPGTGGFKSTATATPGSTAAKTAAAAATYINRELMAITLTTGVMLIVVIAVSVLLR